MPDPNYSVSDTEQFLIDPRRRAFLTGVADQLGGVTAGTAADAGAWEPIDPRRRAFLTGIAAQRDGNPAPQQPNTVKDAIAQEWLNAGYPPAAVAGILRRVGVESGFDVGALGDYVGGQPTSISLYQHHADRAQKLAQYLQSNGVTNTSDPIKVAQLASRFAISEMNGGDPIAAKARTALMNPNISEGDAYGLFTRSFERPKNPDGTPAPGSEETNLHTNTFGPFNQMAQGILSQWQKDVTKRGAEYDAALAESKDIHAASRAALAQWQEEGNHPPQNMREAWSQWGGVAGALAAFGGLFGRNHVAALNAAGAMLQAANAADQRSYDRAYIQWKDHLDRGIKLVELLDKEAHDIVDDAKKSYDQKVAELSILSNAYSLQQQLDPHSVENLSKNIQVSQQLRTLLEAQNQDAEIRSVVAEKREQFKSQNNGAEPPASLVLKWEGDARREGKGLGSSLIKGVEGIALHTWMDEYQRENGHAPSSTEIQQFLASTTMMRREGAVVGTRGGAVELAANKAAALIPLLKERAHQVDLTAYPNVNSVILAAREKTGDPTVVQYGELINSMRYVYASALSPTGAPRVADLEHFDEIMNKAWSPGQIDAALDQIEQSILAEKGAVAKTKEQVRGGAATSPPAGPSTGLPQGIPAGSREIGSYQDRPVYETPDGRRLQVQ